MHQHINQLKLLVVEDNPADLFLLEDLLLSVGYEPASILKASRIGEATHLLAIHNISLVLLDLSLPDSFGLETLREVTTAAPGVPVIVLTGLKDADLALLALKQKAQDYLVKGQYTASLLQKSIEYSIERMKVAERIRLSEEKYRQLFYGNPLPMWIYDEHTQEILEVNDAAIQKYGYSRSQFLTLNLADIEAGQAVHEGANHGEPLLWQHRCSNGKHITVECSSHSVPFSGGTAMQMQVNDVSERINLQQQLLHKKQELVEAVLHAQETERKQIGQELHDNINQVLTAVKLNLGLAREHEDLRVPVLQKCEHHVTQVIAEIRKLSKELILPGNLKELGLAHSVEDLLKEMLGAAGIGWRYEAGTLDGVVLAEDLKLTVYRIMQEQLCNILNHAAATDVGVQLAMDGNRLFLTVKDNGRGFNVSAGKAGLGLTNIASRAELFGGKAILESQPGKGCQLTVWLQTDAVGRLQMASH